MTVCDVSFIVAALNVEPYICAAVRSAPAQSDIAVEVIVVDDGSSDATYELVEAIARNDSRVTLLRHSRSQGVGAARNRALAQARGTWIAILDGDDLVRPGRSRALIDLAVSAGVDVVADNFERFGQVDQAAPSTMIPTAQSSYAFIVGAAAFMQANLAFDKRSLSLGAVKPMFRRTTLEATAHRYRTDVPVGEDYHFCLELLLSGSRLLVTSDSYYLYRMRQGSASWRLDAHHLDRLLAAHRGLDVGRRFAFDRRLVAAAAAYEAALMNARSLTRLVDAVKGRRFAAAFAGVLREPAVWPLVTQTATEAVGKRLKGHSALGVRP